LFGKLKIYFVYIICAIFFALNFYYLHKDEYWVLIVPLVMVFLLMYFLALDKLIYFIIFFTPLSVVLRDSEFGVGVALPTEPLMFGVMILFLFKLILKNTLSREIIKHPVTIAIIIYLVWMLVTSLTSELPVVSLKFLLSRLWFIITFYFIGTQLFKKFENIRIFLWLYVIPLVGVVIYTTILHAQRGFDEQSAHWIMSPFFNDHTAYGAVLALFIPAVTGYIFSSEDRLLYRMLALLALAILILALILSYCRAAWLSIAVSLVIFLILRFKINYKLVFLSFIALVILFLLFQNQIWMKLEKNKQASSKNFTEHLQSISNISTDASNTERLNRWSSAIRMFKKRPVLGWGPGTYQFLYAPYQSSKEKTIISTNVGDKGNAHSEYIGPLSESGILGTLTFLGIVVTVIYTAIKIYKRAKRKIIRNTALIYLISLITYLVHGIMNNFLDTDKSSVPFWGFIAIIVVLDVFFKEDTEITAENPKVVDNQPV